MTAPGHVEAQAWVRGETQENGDQARPARKRTGRRPGTTQSRQAILTAARAKFAVHGYEGASIRAIAQEAGVDTALIHHFFLSKEGLFAASIHDVVHPHRVIEAVVGRRRATRGMGERLVRAFNELWEGENGNKMASIMRSAVSHEAAAQIIRDFFTTEVLHPIVRAAGKTHPEIRAALISSQLVGLGMTRHIIQVQPLPHFDTEYMVDCVAPVIQRYLTGPLPEPEEQ